MVHLPPGKTVPVLTRLKQTIKHWLARCGLVPKKQADAACLRLTSALEQSRLNARNQIETAYQSIASALGLSKSQLLSLQSNSGRAEALRIILQHFGTDPISSLPFTTKLTLRQALEHIENLDCPDHEVRLYVDSEWERRYRVHSCFKEPKTIDWLQSRLQSGDVVYDVGANIGAYSLFAAKASGGRAHVYAFEPSFLNYHQLCRNIILNQCQECVTPFLIPLCRATHLDRLKYQNTDVGGACHSFGGNVEYQGAICEPVNSLGMVGHALDDFLNLAGVQQPTLMKIDVDGLEMEILEGGRSTLRLPTLRSLLIELNEATDEADRCIELLGACGLAPREKHHLSSTIHNFVFDRVAQPLTAPVSATDVPCTWTRTAWPPPYEKAA